MQLLDLVNSGLLDFTRHLVLNIPNYPPVLSVLCTFFMLCTQVLLIRCGLDITVSVSPACISMKKQTSVLTVLLYKYKSVFFHKTLQYPSTYNYRSLLKTINHFMLLIKKIVIIFYGCAVCRLTSCCSEYYFPLFCSKLSVPAVHLSRVML